MLSRQVLHASCLTGSIKAALTPLSGQALMHCTGVLIRMLTEHAAPTSPGASRQRLKSRPPFSRCCLACCSEQNRLRTARRCILRLLAMARLPVQVVHKHPHPHQLPARAVQHAAVCGAELADRGEVWGLEGGVHLLLVCSGRSACLASLVALTLAQINANLDACCPGQSAWLSEHSLQG